MNALSGLSLPISPDMLRASGMAPGGLGQVIPQADLAGLMPGSAAKALSSSGVAAGNFEGTLGQMVGEVVGKQSLASQAVAGLMGGQGVPLHQAVIAMEEASVSFQLMVEVRNKLLESYQELMRMQV